LVFLGKRLLIVFIELFLKLLSIIKEVHALNFLPRMPLIKDPVRGDSLSVVDNAARISLFNGRIIMLALPTLARKKII